MQPEIIQTEEIDTDASSYHAFIGKLVKIAVKMYQNVFSAIKSPLYIESIQRTKVLYIGAWFRFNYCGFVRFYVIIQKKLFVMQIKNINYVFEKKYMHQSKWNWDTPLISALTGFRFYPFNPNYLCMQQNR